MRPSAGAVVALTRGVRPASIVVGVAASLAMATLGATLAGCARGADSQLPPDIVYGEDVCDQCGMIISDARFAAATVVDVDGRAEPRRFDDIADMFAYHRTLTELSVRSWWVHDFATEGWLDATSAYYVQGASIRSPMGGGLAAFATESDAAAFAAANSGHLTTFEALRTTEME